MPGRTGRRRLPTRLKLLRGETRPSRLNMKEPEPPEGVPSKPRRLKGDASREWDRLAELAGDMHVLTEVDAPIVEATAMAYADLTAAERLIAKEGAAYKTTGSGGAVMRRKHPAVDMRADAWRRWVIGLGHLGLSPATRSRVSAQPPKPESKLAKLVRRGA